MRKSLSIVIPAFNEERHIGACLDAIAAQTVKPNEVIVVDNNSTDHTVEIVRRYAFVTLLNEKKQGIVYARNHGFNAAKGDVIGRIDADTILPAGWVSYINHFYEDPANERTAWTGGGYFYNLPRPLAQIIGWGQGQLAYRMNRMLMGYYILWGSNMALPSSAWRAVKAKVCLRNDTHEDVDLAIHVHQAGYRISYHEGIKAGVEARRVHKLSDYKRLWENLQLWPRTLRVHDNRGWVFGYFGAVGLFALWPILWLLLKIREPRI